VAGARETIVFRCDPPEPDRQSTLPQAETPTHIGLPPPGIRQVVTIFLVAKSMTVIDPLPRLETYR
jgi:hypothetical protein